MFKALLDKIPWYVKIPLTSIGAIIGAYMGFEAWVVSKANTVVEPVKTEVSYFKQYSKDHQERVERELIMIRSEQSETNRLLLEISKK
jgi:hypothetical protein